MALTRDVKQQQQQQQKQKQKQRSKHNRPNPNNSYIHKTKKIYVTGFYTEVNHLERDCWRCRRVLYNVANVSTFQLLARSFRTINLRKDLSFLT